MALPAGQQFERAQTVFTDQPQLPAKLRLGQRHQLLRAPALLGPDDGNKAALATVLLQRQESQRPLASEPLPGLAPMTAFTAQDSNNGVMSIIPAVRVKSTILPQRRVGSIRDDQQTRANTFVPQPQAQPITVRIGIVQPGCSGLHGVYRRGTEQFYVFPRPYRRIKRLEDQ